MTNRLLAAAALAFLTLPLAGAQSDVGTPAFAERTSTTMRLRYGFNGASVYDNSTKNWVFLPMTTITRTRVEGYVNRINDQFALAAGLHSVAVYDFSKHRWIENKPGGCDDSSDSLGSNFQLTPTSVRVKILNGPFLTYTSATGWR